MLKVGIFRLQLFKPSEGFITSQTKAYAKYTPIYIGRKLFGNSTCISYVAPKQTIKSISLFCEHVGIVIFRSPRIFIKLLKGIDIGLIHAHFAVDAVNALPLAKKMDIPLVVTLHGMDVTRSVTDMLKSGSPNFINYVIFKRQLLREADLFICVSDFIKQAAAAKGFPEEKLKVHYIGIDTDSLSMREGAGEAGLIVHVGRLVEKKGTKYLLEAFARVKDKISNARLIIIGDGPLKESLELNALSLGIKNNVEFLGMQPNNVVIEWIKRAAIMAVPSVTASNGDSEGLPTVIAEANALGVPVVGFDSAGIKEIVLNKRTGLLSSERDVVGLSENINLLLADPNLRLQMGSLARKNVEDNFNIKKQSAKLETIYDELISRYNTSTKHFETKNE